MTDKTLNIAYWHKKMIRIALNRYDNKKDAAKALGITTRTLSKY
jgi:transcriptional regulator with PAS, ATPase and Fis domain